MKMSFDKMMEGKSSSRITRRGPTPCKCPGCGGRLQSKKVKGIVSLHCIEKGCSRDRIYSYKGRK